MVITSFTDVETTGLDPLSSSVLSLAVVIDVDGREQDSFYQYARPESSHKWSEGAQKIHGITWEQSQTFQSQSDLVHNFLDWMHKHTRKDGHPIPLWQHSRGFFDWRFIMFTCLKQGCLYELYKIARPPALHSTLPLAKKLLRLDSYALDKCCAYYGIELQHHNALSDARACRELWVRLSAEEKML